MTRRRRASGTDRGAATVWTAALVALLVIAGFICLAVAQQALARQRAATAADLAAIAGAQAVADPCTDARTFAERNGGELVECNVDSSTGSPDIEVAVRMSAPSLVVRLFALLGTSAQPITARARAGQPD